jgi:isopropylmalate/homocitrate/citramalate synthase
MTAQPWKTDQWFTSPWNHDPVVRETINLPDRVQIHDTTLRDGEQQAGLLFTATQKARLADLTEVFPYVPLVGQITPRIVFGKGSGPDAIVMAAAELGHHNLADAEIAELLMAVKMQSLGLRRQLTPGEFADLLQSVRASDAAVV